MTFGTEAEVEPEECLLLEEGVVLCCRWWWWVCLLCLGDSEGLFFSSVFVDGGRMILYSDFLAASRVLLKDRPLGLFWCWW